MPVTVILFTIVNNWVVLRGIEVRGRRLNTIEDYERSLKNRYGLGNKSNYKPWLRAQDVPSSGNRLKIEGLKTRRTHHFLSRIEAELFYLLEFSDAVTDIREQFPLFPIDVAMRIASNLGIDYPKNPTSGTPNVMTTDFLVTLEINGEANYEAISVKPEKALDNERVLEKLEIERVWWELLGVPFKLYLRNDLTKIQSENIAWARSILKSGSCFEKDIIRNALRALKTGKHMITQICEEFAQVNQTSKESAYELLRCRSSDLI